MMPRKPTDDELEERVQALEQALQESEERFEAVFDGSRDAIFITDSTTRFVHVNRAACALTGYAREELLGMRIPDLHAPEDRRAFDEYFDRIFSGEAVLSEADILRKDGAKVSTEFSNTRVTIGDGACMHTVARDVSGRRQAEEVYEAQQARLQSLFDNSPEAIVLLDGDNHVTASNAAFERIFGYAASEARGEVIEDLICPERFRDTEAKELDKQALQGIRGEEIIRHRKDGEEIPVRVWAGPASAGDDTAGRFVVFEDIHEQKQAEEALRLSEEKFAKAFYGAPLLITISLLKDGRYVEVNDAFVRITGYTRDRSVGTTSTDLGFISRADRARLIHVLETDGRVREMELELRCADGSKLVCLYSGEVIETEGGAHLISIATDITERKQAEDAVRDRQVELEQILEAMPVALVYADVDRRIMQVNSAFTRMFGYAPEEVLGQKTEIIYARPGEFEEQGRRRYNRQARETYASYEIAYRRKNGEIFPSETVGTPVRDSRDRVIGLLGLVRDITESKRAEEAVRESENRFRTLFEAAPVSMLALQDGKCTLANPASARLLGYERPEDLVGLSALDTIAPESRGLIQTRMAQLDARQRNEPVELSVLRPDGERAWTLSSSVSIDLVGRPAVLVIGQDITRQKRAEQERERLLSAIEQLAEVIVITDAEGTIQYVNPSFEKVTGYTMDEVQGRNPRILKSGRRDEAFYRELWETITGGRIWQGRFVNRKKDGSLYTEEASVSPVFDEGGTVTNFVAVKRDITSEIEWERRLTNAQKMEALGTLAGGIAHDFNNILSAIMGFSEMVEADLPEESRSRDDIKEVITACTRARDLVKQILTFSRQSDREPRPVRLDLVVKEALKMLRSSLPTSIEIRQSVSPDIPAVVADPTQAHQIMMNLCTNASQAMEDGHGTIEVALDKTRLDAEQAARIGERAPGAYVRLEVRDTGEGIPSDALERIFEPYFTTKKVGEGTGLGLAVVYGIVQECGGGITVESRPGRGSTFSVYFPATEKEGLPPSEAGREQLPSGRERILFVDDEPPIARLGRRYLERLGYTVTVQESSEEALALFREDAAQFDLVVTDMTMPRMTGDELAAEILAIRPDMPVILCTGYSSRVSESRAREIGVRAFVMKPLTQSELAHTVRRLLDERPGSH